jgi:hypothetical protein
MDYKFVLLVVGDTVFAAHILPCQNNIYSPNFTATKVEQ